MAKEKLKSKPEPSPAERIEMRKGIVDKAMLELQRHMTNVAQEFELSSAETFFILSESLALLTDAAMHVEHEQCFGEGEEGFDPNS